MFQNSDRRLIFASPYARDFTLIGTVGHAFKGDPAAVSMASGDVGYLCDAANRYFRERIELVDVIRTVSGANLVAGPARRGAARDGAMAFDRGARQGAIADDLRRRRHHRAAARGAGGRPAHAVLSDVAALDRSARRCRAATLPGSGSTTRSTRPSRAGGFSAETQARRLVAAYGSRLAAILGDARDRADLGPAFGPELTGAEVRHLMTKEWARFPDDILWRRSKLGLTMPSADRDALAAFMAAKVS